MLPLSGVHAGGYVATIVNEDEQGGVPEFLSTFFPLLGSQRHRPQVGTRDGKHLLYIVAFVNMLTGALLKRSLRNSLRYFQTMPERGRA
jgi:hypothetical protein